MQQPTDTLHFAGLDFRVTKRILYDICCQAGPVVRISLPEEASTGVKKGYGFCAYSTVGSAKYAHALFQNNLTLFGRQVKVNYSPQGNVGNVETAPTATQAAADPSAAPP